MLFLFKCHIFVSKRCAKMAISKKCAALRHFGTNYFVMSQKIFLSLQAEIRILNYR